MNLLHLRYAIEVARTSSITKAAENLYMGQPNLSRAIKELEEDLGIIVFKRTSKGITPTPQGEEFLSYARSILSQVDAIERLYKGERPSAENFSISASRSDYIAAAFADFVKTLGEGSEMELTYKETNTLGTIQSLTEANVKLGIIKYRSVHDAQIKALLEEKNLAHELICEFKAPILLSKNHPLARSGNVSVSDAEGMIEISYGDTYVPSLPASEAKKDETTSSAARRIYVHEREIALRLLSEVYGTFMTVTPVPADILEKYNLTMCELTGGKYYRELLIYKNDYRLTNADRLFIDELMKHKRSLPLR